MIVTQPNMVSTIATVAAFAVVSAAAGGVACLPDGTPVLGEMAFSTVTSDPFDDANVSVSITDSGTIGAGTDLTLIDPWVTGDFADGCTLTSQMNTSWSDFPYNGLRFTIEDLGGKIITNATLIDTNVPGFDQSRVFFEDDRIAYNFAGISASGHVTVEIEYDDAPTPCPGDVDGSGDVGFNDLVTVLASWGDCPGCPADVDGDGSVGFSDVVAVLASWGQCP